MDYVAPEIVSGCQYDAKVDVWSLGVLCFELTTGRAPFENRINREAFNNIVNLNFKFPEYLSEMAKDFINRLLVKDPHKDMTLKKSEHTHFSPRELGSIWTHVRKKSKSLKSLFKSILN